MQETLQLWTVFGRLQSLKNFRLSVNWRFSSLKKRQSVPYIVPWPQENEKYNKLKKRNSEIRPWAFLRNRSWLSSHPAWSKSTSTGMDRVKNKLIQNDIHEGIQGKPLNCFQRSGGKTTGCRFKPRLFCKRGQRHLFKRLVHYNGCLFFTLLLFYRTHYKFPHNRYIMISRNLFETGRPVVKFIAWVNNNRFSYKPHFSYPLLIQRISGAKKSAWTVKTGDLL